MPHQQEFQKTQQMIIKYLYQFLNIIFCECSINTEKVSRVQHHSFHLIIQHKKKILMYMYRILIFKIQLELDLELDLARYTPSNPTEARAGFR